MNYPSASSHGIIPFEYRPSIHFPPYYTVPDHEGLDILSPATQTRRDLSARFAAILAQEVRNPLTNIYLSIDMLKSANTDKGLDIYVDIIMRSSMRINHLINELLQYQENEECQEDHLLLIPN